MTKLYFRWGLERNIILTFYARRLASNVNPLRARDALRQPFRVILYT